MMVKKMLRNTYVLHKTTIVPSRPLHHRFGVRIYSNPQCCASKTAILAELSVVDQRNSQIPIFGRKHSGISIAYITAEHERRRE
jgi:hypothetical protein